MDKTATEIKSVKIVHIIKYTKNSISLSLQTKFKILPPIHLKIY